MKITEETVSYKGGKLNFRETENWSLFWPTKIKRLGVPGWLSSQSICLWLRSPQMGAHSWALCSADCLLLPLPSASTHPPHALSSQINKICVGGGGETAKEQGLDFNCLLARIFQITLPQNKDAHKGFPLEKYSVQTYFSCFTYSWMGVHMTYPT